MNLEIDPQQYKTLLKTILLARWVLPDTMDPEHSEAATEYETLFQHIMAEGSKQGLSEFLHYEEGADEYHPDHGLEEDEELVSMVEEFSDRNFWEELLLRLVSREMIEVYGEETVMEMGPEERMEKEQEIFDRYGEEFEENGLDNLRMRK